MVGSSCLSSEGHYQRGDVNIKNQAFVDLFTWSTRRELVALGFPACDVLRKIILADATSRSNFLPTFHPATTPLLFLPLDGRMKQHRMTENVASYETGHELLDMAIERSFRIYFKTKLS
jgi:hypothetical protein